MECFTERWTSPRPSCERLWSRYLFKCFTFSKYTHIRTTRICGVERCGCPVIRNPRAVRGFGCIAQGYLSSTQEVNWHLSRYLPGAKLLPRQSYCCPTRSIVQKNQWSRWGKTLNILWLYCFNMRTNQKELWDIQMYLFFYSQRHNFLESGLSSPWLVK